MGPSKIAMSKGMASKGEEERAVSFVGSSLCRIIMELVWQSLGSLALPLSSLLPVPLPLGTLCDVINAFLLLFHPLHEPAELPTECDKTTRVRYWLPLVTWSSLPSSNFQLN